MTFPARRTTISIPRTSTRLPVGELAAVGHPERTRVRPLEDPLVGERVALFDVADEPVMHVRGTDQLLRETGGDGVPSHERAVRHALDRVVGVQVHDPLEVSGVVPLDVLLQ